MSSSDSSTLNNPSEPTIPFTVVSLGHITKLCSTNYSIWEPQLTATLTGYGVIGYVNGTKIAPAKTITIETVSKPNPAYETWLRQDKLIFGAIVGTVSPSLQPLISRSSSSLVAWQTLAKTFASPSRGHIKQIKTRMRNITKGSRSVTEYMCDMKTCADQLASLDNPMKEEDIVDKILEQIHDSDYDVIVNGIHSRESDISFDELNEKLVNHEALLQQQSYVLSSVPITANYAQKQHYKQPSSSTPIQPHITAPKYQAKPYNGKCQWCRQTGHFVSQCPIFLQQFPNATPPNSGPTTTAPQPKYGYKSAPLLHKPKAYTVRASLPHSEDWLLDSGASHHVTNDLENLSVHAPYGGSDELIIGDGSGLPINNTGSFYFSLNSTTLNFHNVLHVPSASRKIISLSQLCRDNHLSILFLLDLFYVKDTRTGTIIFQGQSKFGVYEWNLQSKSSAPTVHAALLSPLDWHHRLGHPSQSKFKQISSLFNFSIPNSFYCNSCHCNKSHKLPFSNSSLTSNGPLDIIFSDVWCSPINSFDGHKYYLIFVDHYSKYIWLYPLKKKSDTEQIFIRFHSLVENFFQRKIITFYSDNGGEFEKLKSFFGLHGISHLTSPPHTPQHNGYAERRHRHIVETGLSLLQHASMPLKFWSLGLSTAVYLINRMPTVALSNQSAFSTLFKKEPNYKKLRSFGCLCYPWLKPYANNKLQPKSKPCIFVGYSPSQSAYYCMDKTTHRIYVSRHVRFIESVFPFADSNPLSNISDDKSAWSFENIPSIDTKSDPPSVTQVATNLEDNSDAANISNINNIVILADKHPTNLANLANFEDLGDQVLDNDQVENSNSNNLATDSANSGSASIAINSANSDSMSTTNDNNTNSNNSSSSNTKSQHNSASSQATPTPAAPTSMITRSKNNIHKPNPKYLSSAIMKSTFPEPSTVKQALKSPSWTQAMRHEYDALMKNNTWTLVPESEAANLVGCKWIFRTKYKADGSIERLKARLVAKGFHQRPGLDYSDTFSPVVKAPTVRLIMTIAITQRWPLRQLDINNAFLQGKLSEDVFMQQPPGFVDPTLPNHVCKLKKAIYGLKQAPRAWYIELRNYLLGVGFINTISDSSLFIFNGSQHIIYLLVYVDDIIVTGSNEDMVTRFISTLAARFSLKDLGMLSYFLGVEVLSQPSGIFLSQRKYISDILERAKMAAAKPSPTPMNTSRSLSLHSGSPLSSPTEYRALIGSLQYLSLTRPDVAFCVNRLSQYMHRPTDEHYTALKRLLRYLAGSLHKGVLIRHKSPINLHAFTDADWAGNRDDYISTTGYIVYLGSNPISWSSNKQRTVARSSTEAEYRALASTTAEILWVINLLKELNISSHILPTIYCDNIGATYVAANPKFHSKMKHIGLDYHFVRQSVQNGSIRVSYISNKEQLADALTKPLPRQQFHDNINKIGLTVPQSILRGDVKG